MLPPFHVSRWPPGWRSDRRRVPAILTQTEAGWQIIDSQGQAWNVSSHAEVLAVAGHPYPEETEKPTKLDVFTSRLPHYPFLEEAMASDKTTAYSRGRQRIGGLVCQVGRLKIRIEEAAAWKAEEANDDFLQLLRKIYDLLGVGAHPTPGGLGMCAMEECYLKAGYERQSRPSHALRQALLDNRIGGRSDWTDSGEVFAQVWEADQRNAYCSAAAMDLPVGGVVRFLDDEVEVGDTRYPTWYAYCTVINRRKTSNSPILERLSSGRLLPYTRFGHLNTWLWKEEAEAATQAGQTVIVHEGWAWLKMAPVLRPWAERMHDARRVASRISPDLERMVKLCIVAAIGRHGCRPERRSVIPAIHAGEGDTILTDTLDAQWANHTEPDSDAPWNTVWHSFIEMQVRLANYQLQESETDQGNEVIGSNVDAVYLRLVPHVAHEPDKLGGWRHRERHNVYFPYIRAIVSDEKTSLPGASQESERRKELIDAFR